ncbi:phytanoyl-CoA dioxygenase family protein [Pseudoalteromonas phenolica]|uniref:phytanoyl-CoA dioxygenase family protein n=1 Tax=Pseudoalteromonas phenolica TaxID=161398 RepID=UPI0014870D0D|nr:phytanoyl-CoA dioxygenase family protein [Pseudoalteromonas phenolica]
MQNDLHYETHGFTACEFPKPEIELIKKASSRIIPIISGDYNLNCQPWGINRSKDQTSLVRISQPHLCDSLLKSLICDSSLGRIVAKTTNSKSVRVWGTQLYYKGNATSQTSVVGWHRDAEHMPYFKKGSITAWLPFIDTNEENGTIHYIKGSHKWKSHFVHTGAQIQHWAKQNQSLREQAIKSQNSWGITPLHLKIGQFSLHHCKTLHGSSPNYSNTARPALAIGLLLDDYEIDDSVPDYGFANALNDPSISPIIY